ncbi:MAG: AcrB/AcrD/AcrF family protein [Candidatus Parabeggiatoa sp. nov. 1]|nr:MAG: AcrB/AcrD/AcrF family protein [Gammaproteobacteria bacterium]HEC84782.1 efflux RND transporter permease subunit [Thioploca sp.]
MTKIVDIAIHSNRTVLLLLLFILISGAIAYRDIPKDSDPDIAIPFIYVSMTHEGISPEDAERLLVRPMEKELRTIEGIKEMTAIAGEGQASVTLEFDAGFNSEKALRDVLQKVDIAKVELPDDSEEPSVHEINLSRFPILVIILAGDVPERTLLTLARQLKEAVEAIPEVLKIDIAGDREEVIDILIDPLRVESYNLNFEEVIPYVLNNNQLVAAGALDTGQGRFNVKVPGVFESLQDIFTLPIKTDDKRVVTLQDVAQIRRTFKDQLTYARVNGKPALALEVSKRAGTNIIETIAKTRYVVEQFKKELPDNIRINFIQDKSKEIRNMLKDLQNNVLSAVLLVSIVILGALGIHTATLVAIAIPGSFLLGILVLAQMGLTMNIVVLFSLILASGMLIDGAIIVTEFADRKMSEGMPRKEAYALAAKRMFWPIIGATATTLAVFFPLLFWPGIIGEFMKYLPITIIATLSASLIMALIFMPTLGALFGKPRPIKIADHDTAPLHTIKGFTGLYVRALGGLIRFPITVLVIAVLLLVAVNVAYVNYGKGIEFFPDVEPEQINIYVRARGNLSVQERDQLVREVEERILDMHEFASVYANSGMVSADNAPEDTIGVIAIEFVDWQQRRKARDIIKEIRQRTADLAGIFIEIIKQEGGPGEGKPIQIEISAKPPALLNPAAAELVAGFQTIAGLVDIEDSRPLPGIDWKIVVDRTQASRFGADIAIVGNGIQLVTNGIIVTDYRPNDADKELDIRLRFPPEYRSIDQLDRLRIQTQAGLVPISLFVERIAQPSVGTIKRSEERRILTVQAGVEEGVLVADKLNEIHAWLDSLRQQDSKSLLVDPRVTLTFKGEDKDQREAEEFLSRAFITALFFIMLFLITQFNSFYQTLLILSAVILSTIGVLLGLLITGQPFGIVMCGIGVIALAGIVVNNNIVLIDTFNVLRATGMEIREAVLRTAAQRLRPVLLTAITTILGLMPMVLAMTIDLLTREIAFGAPSTQWWTQLATSIAGGLAFATLLTLVLTPCLLVLGGKNNKGIVNCEL